MNFQQASSQQLTDDQIELDFCLRQHFGYYLVYMGFDRLRRVASSPIKNHLQLFNETQPIYANQRHTLSARAAYQQLPFAIDSVDAFVFDHVFEHGYDNRHMLEQVWQVLRHDGCIIITLYNPWQLAGRLAWQRQMHALSDEKQVWQMCTLASLKKLLRRQGFKVTRVRRSGLPKATRWWAVLAKLFPWLASGYVLLAQKQTYSYTPVKPIWTAPKWSFGKACTSSFNRYRSGDYLNDEAS